MLERDVQKKVVTYATKKGVKGIRMYFGPGMRVGWPDYLFLIPGGNSLFIEFKATGKRPTKKQQEKITLLIGLEFSCHVCDNVEYGKKLIDLAVSHRLNR